MLSETFMNDNEPPVSIPNFYFMVRFQRNGLKHSGVEIYHNKEDKYIVTPNLQVKAPYSRNASLILSSLKRIGDLCAVECKMNESENSDQKLFLVAIYISPNTTMKNIKLFISKALFPLLLVGSQALSELTGGRIND